MLKFFKYTLIWMLILSLVFPSFAIAKSKSKRGVLERVHTESITFANMKISALDTGAFIDFSDSETNKLIDHLGYLIKIRDSSNRVIQGFAKAAGSGETFTDIIGGTDPALKNGDFSAGDTIWSKGTGVSIGAGVAVAAGGGAAYGNVLFQSVLTSPVGKLYKVSVGLPAYTSGNYSAVIGGYDYVYDLGTVYHIATLSEKYLTVTNHSANTVFYIKNGNGAIVGSFDNIILQQVLTPSATGITITNTKGGSTYNFAAKDSSFNYADSSGYTVELWKVNNAVEVATGSIPAGESKMDTTTANAFAAPESSGVPIDLSAYQDGRHLFWVQDSNGKVACGWISDTAPGGEGGVELVDTWTNNVGNPYETLTLDGLNITQAINTAAVAACYKNNTEFAKGTLIKVVSNLTLSSGQSPTVYFYPNTNIGGIAQEIITLSSGANSVYKTITIEQVRSIAIYNSAATDFALAGSSYLRLTDCAATGALLLSTQGGSRGYMLKDSAFNANLTLTYKILYVGAP